MQEKEKLEAFYATTQSDGWTQVFVPGLQRKRDSLLGEVLRGDPADPMTNQRVGIKVLDFILDMGKNAGQVLHKLEEMEKDEGQWQLASGSPYDPPRRV